MSTKKIITNSPKETQQLASRFARQILRQKLRKHAVILGLQGDLGTGKTTFLQGFARGLGIREKILSPTFIIMKKFKIPKSKKNLENNKKSNILQIGKLSYLWYQWFYHFDCYRLDSPKEILHLRFKEIISNPKNIVAIEWPEKISAILPKKTILIKFEHNKGDQRTLTIKE